MAARPDCKAYRTALSSRCCGYRRPDPLGRRTTCQYDGHRHRNRSAERHVGCAGGRQARSGSGDLEHGASPMPHRTTRCRMTRVR